MKGLIFAFIVFNPAILLAQILDTPHFKIVINCQSSESPVGCDKVSYEGTNKATGGTISLIGTQLMKECADGVTSCQSLGYEFTNGTTTYFISEDGHLQVIEGAKVLVDEIGTWTF